MIGVDRPCTGLPEPESEDESAPAPAWKAALVECIECGAEGTVAAVHSLGGVHRKGCSRYRPPGHVVSPEELKVWRERTSSMERRAAPPGTHLSRYSSGQSSLCMRNLSPRSSLLLHLSARKHSECGGVAAHAGPHPEHARGAARSHELTTCSSAEDGGFVHDPEHPDTDSPALVGSVFRERMQGARPGRAPGGQSPPALTELPCMCLGRAHPELSMTRRRRADPMSPGFATAPSGQGGQSLWGPGDAGGAAGQHATSGKSEEEDLIGVWRAGQGLSRLRYEHAAQTAGRNDDRAAGSASPVSRAQQPQGGQVSSPLGGLMSLFGKNRKT